ncbi:MAG: hypothetical protein KDA42_03215 [Planctomycetales bacterium]|nr:hypothetical protein [Planctomycetales bacterium]
MVVDHAGYIDYDDKIRRFNRARCVFKNGKLDVVAEARGCTLKLFGIPFSDSESVADLAGKSFGPNSEVVRDDPIAEGGVEMGENYFSWLSLTVRCKKYDTAANTLSVSFQAEIEEVEWGDSGDVDGAVVCEVVESLW